MKRRVFIKRNAQAGLLMMAGQLPLQAFAGPEIVKLIILHTNDVHSRIEPFPMDGSWRQGRGGAARRAQLIQQIRASEPNVLLFDSGDIFQGTPYFNLFGGELELKLMSRMRYDATTIGNHDFDAGLEGLLKQLPLANFPFLVSNYDFSDTPMEGQTFPYKLFEKAGLKIGVFGLGIELEGLVPKKDYGNTRYEEPVAKANEYAALLSHELHCDYVICLSHLGHRYESDADRICDVTLAAATSGIDLILGGHTHTFLEQPELVKNAKGELVMINQVGWGGMMLGRIDVFFERNRKNRCVSCANHWVE